MLRALIAVLSIVTLAGACFAEATVAKRQPATDAGEERLANGGFELLAGGRAESWGPWSNGYVASREAARSGEVGALVHADDEAEEYGASCAVTLNQTAPFPIVATGWSRAENVSGVRDRGYAIWLDVTYQDGDHLWGQAAGFGTGTHGWERQQVVLAPTKPIRDLSILGLFRGHTGTARFDDFSLREITGASCSMFDGVPVISEPAEAGADPRVLVRDVAANGDFLLMGAGADVEAGDADLGLEVSVHETALGSGRLIEGEARDTTGRDRALSVYYALPLDATGWAWWDDPNTPRPIEEGLTYLNARNVGVGNTGLASWYPLAALSGPDRGVCLAVPLDSPRICRLAYDSGSEELYAAFDLGLSPDAAKTPQSATFRLAVFDFEPEWGFRAALDAYYGLFPEFFEKRTTHEGQWMPFTDIATVREPMDFGFAYHEGNNNVPWDDAHDILSFVYVEPMTNWMRMEPDAPRTHEAADALMRQKAGEGDRQALATLSSVVVTEDGRLDAVCIDAPWCDGAVFTLNADPDVPADPDGLNQFDHEWATIEHAFHPSVAGVPGWSLSGGSALEGSDEGGSALRLRRSEGADPVQVTQNVTIGQTEARTLVARARGVAENVVGETGGDCSLYVDLTYSDGTNLFGQIATLEPGVAGWQDLEVLIRPAKPVQAASVHLLLRGEHLGEAWFDDVSLVEEGSDRSFVVNGDFEGVDVPTGDLDGTYIDSFEGWSTRVNSRREHFAAVDVPLTFTVDTRAPAILTYFSTYEFAKELSARMHDEGKLLMANAVPANFPWAAHLLDVMGTETNWNRNGETPDSHESFRYRRALCRWKPYLLLQNTDYGAFTPEMVERYFKRAIFYGAFPGFFSHNAADDPYWNTPALYDRDRPLFLKYMPICSDLSRAGWEPVTLARSDTPGVLLERFGAPDRGEALLTVFNDGDRPTDAVIALDMEALGNPNAAEELVGERPVAIHDGSLTLRLRPKDLAVLRMVSAR